MTTMGLRSYITHIVLLYWYLYAVCVYINAQEQTTPFMEMTGYLHQA